MGAAKDKPFTEMPKVSQSEWDRIFGKKTEKPKPGRYVTVDGKLIHEDDLPADYREIDCEAPAVHDERTYTKRFDWGAGRKWNSKAERREWMKRRGRECIG
jgi:hypothetical protein